ncbi:hypothetical protein [Paradesulfitobacterium aromaticivorans]
MLLRFLAGMVLIVSLISVSYSAYFYGLQTWLSGRKLLAKIRSVKISPNHRLVFMEKAKTLKREEVTTFFLDLITLDSKVKRRIIFYAFPISVILSIPPSILRFSKFTTWLGFFCVVITLLGLAKFLGRNYYGYYFDKIGFYFLKLCIFAIYSLSFFVGYLKYPSNDVFFIFSLLTTIIFSVYFLKSIIDGFEHIWFCVANLLLVYVYDLLAIGLHFGFFYLQNNEIFKLFANIQQYNSLNLVNLLTIIQLGLLNFYSLSTSSMGFESLKNFAPFFEYMFGAVFNVGIIGFFISYMASKIFKKALDEENRKGINSL